MNTTHNRSRLAKAAVTAVAALGAIPLTLSTPVAHAEPAQLWASPNPVVVPWGQTTGWVGLHWKIEEGGPQAMITVRENNHTFEILYEQFPGETVDVPLKLTLGNKYHVEIEHLHTGEPLAAPITITTTQEVIDATIATVPLNPSRTDSTIFPVPPNPSRTDSTITPVPLG